MFFTLEVSGYYVNRKGEILANTVVFVDTHPDNARIYINGQLERSRTGARLVLPEGQYFVELVLPGYQPWQKSLYLEGNSVSYLKYPFLYPVEPVQNTVSLYETMIYSASQSLDRRWLAVQPEPDELVLDIIDLDDDELQSRQLSIDIETASSTNGPLISSEIVRWSTDSRYILMRLEFPDLDEYWILDTEDESEVIKLPSDLDEKVARHELVDGRVDQVYTLYENGDLYLVDLNDEADEIKLVAGNVLEFSSYGKDLLIYSQLQQSGSPVSVIINSSGVDYVLAEFSVSDSQSAYSLDVARFENDWYYVVGSDTEPNLRIFKNPLQRLKDGAQVTPTVDVSINSLNNTKFSHNTRFIGAADQDGIYVYDLDSQRSFRYSIDNLSPSYNIRWMDGHRMYGEIGGDLLIWEFDGTHTTNLGHIYDVQAVFFDKSYDNLYLLLVNDTDGVTESSLQHTKLILEQN